MIALRVNLGWVQTPVNNFFVSISKFTKLTRTLAGLQFALHWPIVDIFGDTRERSRKFSEIAANFYVVVRQILGGGAPILGLSSSNYNHFGSCGKVLRRSAEGPRRLVVGKKHQRPIRTYVGQAIAMPDAYSLRQM